MLRAQAMQDLNAANIGLNGFLRFAVVKVIAWVQAGLAYLHYGYQDWISLQSNPVTATDEFALLWGGLIGVQVKDATPAVLSATFTGTVSLSAGTAVNRQDGTPYTITTGGTPSGSSVITVQLTAALAGSAGNCDVGTPMTLASIVPGVVSSSGAVVSTILPGTDQEDINTAYKTRYLAEYAAPPQGGDRADYIEWATAVPGITRAWVAPQAMGAGTVSVYFMMDAVEAAHGGFPQGNNGVATNETRDTAATGDQLVLANALFPDQPVTALVYAVAPTPQAVSFTITGLGVNNTSAMLTAMQTALAGMFLSLGNVGGTVNPADGSAWPAIESNDWYAALNAIPGLSGFTVASPTSPISPSTGALFTVGTVTPVT